MNIIGATSPATLFFTPANDMEYVGKKIVFNTDKPFDSEYEPLYRRDFEYFKYMWSMRECIANFNSLFPEVYKYLDLCFEHLRDSQKEELRGITRNSDYYENNYDELFVNTSSQQCVRILDFKLRSKKSVNEVKSDFEIIASENLKDQHKQSPLALPVDLYTEHKFYVSGRWNKDTVVPYVDERAIDQRTLPGDGAQYPYLTVSDLLEDTIVKIPYSLNSNDFFDGNYYIKNVLEHEQVREQSYLLPISKTFFRFFTPEDLQGKVNGKKRIEIHDLAGDAVKVVLRIPIKGDGYIQYERVYYPNETPDINNNKGAIVKRYFTIGIFPFLKYPAGVSSFYRVTLLDRDSLSNAKDNTYKMSFFDHDNMEVAYSGIIRKNRNADNTRFDKLKIDSITYALDANFQYITVSDNADSNVYGVIIPKMSAKNGGLKYRFAIDLGTSNTHIEYSVKNGIAKPFDITRSDMQLKKLHQVNDEYEITDVFEGDFMPDTIGDEGSICRYPLRTVLSESVNTNWSKPVFTIGHTNISYTYEKRQQLIYNNIYTNLKWSTSLEDQERTDKYIETLLLTLRNKVLLNNGNLEETEVVWSYPASMTQSRFNQFKRKWEAHFNEIFKAPKSNIIAIPESIAPYNYYKNKEGATSTVVSIDIGGGTTDVLIVDDGSPKYLTSFRFAANTIFGDGYSYGAGSNGIINEHKETIKKILGENDLSGLLNVFNELFNNGNDSSSEIISFFFSLAENKDVMSKQAPLRFDEILMSDDRVKYAILLFYVAIMYHIAKLMKAKDMPQPRHITFSGNGAKVLNILSPSDVTLVEFTKLIFEKIYDEKYLIDGLDIIRPENSKEATSKGGIFLSPFKSQDYSEINTMKTILLGNDDDSFVPKSMTYNDVTDDVKQGVVETVKDYIEFAFSLNKDFSFYQHFDVNQKILNQVKELCYRDIENYLNEGINQKKKENLEDGGEEVLEETLFFYPIVGMINAVVRNIYKMD